ncbi:aspartate aminotransferase, partial [Candidatus Woesearchaeota archaeon CG_4_10_14_0_8_um_filter_47_5]
SIAQKAALAALTGPQECVQEMVSAFDRRRRLMVRLLNNIKGISCALPDGAFYCFADISGTGLGSAVFGERLLEEAHVAVVPGIAFGSEGFVRLSYATGEKVIVEGLLRMKRWVEGLVDI